MTARQPAAAMTPETAVRVIAVEVIRRAVVEALADDSVAWGAWFPEIDESDWQLVKDQVTSRILHPAPGRVAESYEVLRGRS